MSEKVLVIVSQNGSGRVGFWLEPGGKKNLFCRCGSGCRQENRFEIELGTGEVPADVRMSPPSAKREK